MSKFVTYPAVTVLDNDHALLIDSPSAGTNSITADNAADTLLSKWSGFDTFDEAVQNTISNNQEFIDRDTAIRSETADLKKKIVTTFPAKEASGQIATFESEFEDAPLKSCIVQVNPVQAGSGDPSPDNVRPISGWNGAKVTRTGKNFVGLNTSPRRRMSYSGVTASEHTDNKVVLTSDETTNYAQMGLYYALPEGTYTASVKASSDDADYTPTVSIYNVVSTNALLVLGITNDNAVTFTVPKDAIINIRFFASTKTAKARTVTYYDFQLELGSTATAYEPYSGQTYDITFPTEAGTVYGGTLDVTKGELVVDRAVVDLGTPNWYYRETFTGFSAPLTPEAKVAFTAICSAYPFVGAYNITTDKTCGYIYEKQIFVKDYDYTDPVSFKTAMSGVQLCYELATPIEIPLTANQMTTLLGQNNLWANTGDTAVEYLMSDVSWYVEKKLRAFQSILAGVEDSAVASKNYSTDNYLIFNDDIYRVTKTITAGETIEDGVNVTKTTVAEQLMALAQA